MKGLKIAGISIGVLILVIQFVRPDRTAGPSGSDVSMSAAFPVNEDVGDILSKACYDCHSNGTRYPWYSEVQPVGWWIQEHIDDGRRHMNFDEFLNYSPARQYRKFSEIESEVREELMPLDSYLPLHPEARLTDEERRLLTSWSKAMRDSMYAWYPADSLQPRRSRPQNSQ